MKLVSAAILIVAVIAVNQMIGPIAMKQALTRAGETREA